MTASVERPVVSVLLTAGTKEMVLGQSALDQLAEVAEVRTAEGEPGDWDLAGLLGDATACVTGWGTPRLTAEVLAGCERLGLVAHTAGSIRNLVPEELVGSRIRVCQSAAVIAMSVAEHVLTQILMCLRELHRLDQGLRAGKGWGELRTAYPGRLLRSRTVGVIGASRTGRAVIDLLRAFGARILISDPLLDEAEASRLGGKLVDSDTLLAGSDIVTLHAPLLPSTENMVGARELALLRDGAILINSARGRLVDPEALYAELASGRITAALDVFEEEPLGADSRWRTVPGAVISPHSAGHTLDSHRLQGTTMIEEVVRFLGGDDLRYEVTADVVATLA